MKPGTTKRLTYIVAHNGESSDIVSEHSDQKQMFRLANDLRRSNAYPMKHWRFEVTCEPTDEQLKEWNE